jgi:hypothetical protein
MSDDGKRWFKVTGLAAGPAYTFAHGEQDARLRVGDGYLDATAVPESEAIAHFLPDPELPASPASS